MEKTARKIDDVFSGIFQFFALIFIVLISFSPSIVGLLILAYLISLVKQ